MAQTLVDISLLKDREVASLLDTAMTNIVTTFTPFYSAALLADGITNLTGAGFSVGDTVTLTCVGATITTNPVVVIVAVSSGVPTFASLSIKGVFTSIPASNNVIFTQSATSGSGTGFSCKAKFGPIAADLATGNLPIDGLGSLFIGDEQPNAALWGAENVFIGDRAGGNAVGNAVANTFIGHNAGGIGNGATWTGSFNVAIGNDCMRNITGTATNNVGIGQSTLRVVAGGGNVAIGQGVLALCIANNNTVVGSFAAALLVNSGTNCIFGLNAGNKITNGANSNVIVGSNVATTTLQSGSNNVLIGTNSSVDVASGSTSNTFQIGAGSTAILSATVCNTPALSITTIAGTLIVAGTNAAITYTGITFANRPPTPAAGMVCYFTDSTIATWGSTIAGTGANKVLGWYNGTNWTVTGV